MRRASIGAGLLLAAALAAGGCENGKPGEDGARGEAGDQVGPRGRPSDEQGAEGGEGPEGPKGPPTDAEPAPSLVSCEPGALYLGHVATVTVSGDDTSWASGDAALDLGDDVWVDQVIVASPTALVADVTVSVDAEPGPLDVLVSGAGSDLSLSGALEVLPSIVVQAESGAVASGSSFFLDLVMPDLSAPIDPETLRVEIPGAVGLAANVVSASPYAVRLRVTSDVFADTGAFDLLVHSGEVGTVTSSRGPSALALAPRSADVLDLFDMPVGVAAPGVAGSHLYAFTPPDPLSEVKLGLVASGGEGGGAPTMIVIPPSGVITEPVATGLTATFLAEGDEPYFVLVIDASGAPDYVYDLTATVTAAAPVESEPNDTCGGPGDVVTDFPANFVGALADGADEDWYRIDLDAAEGLQRLRARTTAGDVDTDVELTVFAGDCSTVAGGPQDIDFHENLVVGPLGEGTWFVRVRPSPTFPFAGSLYKLAFTLEP